MQKALFSLLLLLFTTTAFVQAQKTVAGKALDKIEKFVSDFNHFIGPVERYSPSGICSQRVSSCKTVVDKLYKSYINEVNTTCQPKRIRIQCCYKDRPTETVVDIKPTNPRCYRVSILEHTGISKTNR